MEAVSKEIGAAYPYNRGGNYMITIIEEISAVEMLRDWALAEASSERRIPYVRTYLTDEVIRKVTSQKASDLSEKELENLEQMILKERSDLLSDLLKLNVEWHRGNLPLKEVEGLRIMDWPPFVNLVESRGLVDLVRAFQAGKMPPNHHGFETNLHKMKAGFSFDKMVGTPILVARSKEPPYVLIEGFTRLSAMLLNVFDGIQYVEALPVILGVSQRLDEWDYF